MDRLSTSPAADWPRRFTVGFSVLLMLIAGSALLSWWLDLQPLTPIGRSAGMPPGAATLLFLLGGLLAAYEGGHRRLCALGLIPAVAGGISLYEELAAAGGGLARSTSAGAGGHQALGYMAIATATTLLLVGSVLASLALPQRPRRRKLLLASAGSVTWSIGAATLLGYMLDLRGVYHWGLGPVMDLLSGVALMALGFGVLSLAWGAHQRQNGSAPAWLPLPVFVGSTTLTLILWGGLRQREIDYLASTTQVSVNSLANAINLEFEKQANLVERIGRRWSQPDANHVVWEVDAVTHRSESAACLALSIVDLNGVTRWHHPARGNEHFAAFNHAREEPRRIALEQARRHGVRAVSGTVELPTSGFGFAIYAPIFRDDVLWGFVGAEYSYARLFSELVGQRLRLNDDFSSHISVGDHLMHESVARRGTPMGEHAGIDLVFSLFDRRIRINLVPSDDLFHRVRRFLPELALAAGCGITFLLGLSVHLARAAYTHLRESERSNRRLQAENEERRRVEAMLKVSDERLRLALDSTHIGIFEWNLPSNHVYYSPGLWMMLGYSPAPVDYQPDAWTALIHPDDLPSYKQAVEQQLTGETTFIDPEYRVRSGQGEWRWLYARAKTVTRAPNGAPIRILGTLQDVTGRKRAEAALRASQATTRKLSLVASRTDNIVIIGTPEGTVDWVNESFTRVMEYGLDEIRGLRPASLLMGPETDVRTAKRIAAALRRGVGHTTDVVAYSKSGRKYYLHLEIQPIRNEAGVLETFIAILADITSRVETEQMLRRAKREADAASRAKSEFLASMSHELRTPMNGVIGMTGLLLETTLDFEQRDFVNTIRTSGETLLTIINDILDFSKIESGKMELERLPLELPNCVEEALDLFAAPAAAKKLELAYHVEEDVPSWILGDVTRLRQVLVNLVNNAVKFTPSGSITVQVRRVPRTETPSLPADRMLLEICVADTGIGIPSDRMDRLFKPFSQVDSSTTRRFGGTGLGLAICHRLTHLMGGGIRAESEENIGSRFIVTIATEAAEPPVTVAPFSIPAALQQSYVLGVEDNEVAQKRFAALFRSWGITYLPVATASAGLQALRRQPPALVIFDHDLLATAHGPHLAMAIDEQRLPTLFLLAPGHSSHHAPFQRPYVIPVSKPAKTTTLVRCLHTALKTNLAISDPHFAVNEVRKLAEDFPLDVLLVEDNPVNQKVALRFLSRLGYRADSVGNGREAVTVLESRHYDLVIMDLQMPEMDGCEAARHIRRLLPPNRQPRIVALTANAMQGDRELCLAAGMDDYLAKPVRLHELSEVIRRQFTRPALERV
jgi:PAS domain S-box-containing protein